MKDILKELKKINNQYTELTDLYNSKIKEIKDNKDTSEDYKKTQIDELMNKLNSDRKDLRQRYSKNIELLRRKTSLEPQGADMSSNELINAIKILELYRDKLPLVEAKNIISQLDNASKISFVKLMEVMNVSPLIIETCKKRIIYFDDFINNIELASTNNLYLNKDTGIGQIIDNGIALIEGNEPQESPVNVHII